MNPYLNRVMIKNPREFYGRRAEVRRILARIGAERPQCMSIVGERRIGKSSLLAYLTDPEIQERHKIDRSQLVIVYFDFQQLRNIVVKDFFSFLLAQIRQLSRESQGAGRSGYDSFQELLEELRTRKKKLVLLFDEFQAITCNAAFNVEFYSFLRSMANNYEIAYVTSSHVELQRLCCSSDISDSPFFNIFSNLYLKNFELEEARELISRPSGEEGVSLKVYADEIIELAGLFPFYLQIACSIYFDCMKGHPDTVLDREAVRSRFLEEAAPHFDYIWEHAEPECRGLLERVAREEPLDPAEAHVCQSLVRKGYLIKVEDRWELFSSAFCDHIRALASSPAESTGTSTPGIPGATNPMEPGVRVNQYMILRRAGMGGMGVVYEAQDTALNRKVALKFIKPELLRDSLPRKRFFQEARAAARLNHPAIASVYELFEYCEQVGLALEWIEGTTLKQQILRRGRIELLPLLKWMVEALEGLSDAHQKGIIHRDINSSNLMITTESHVKLMDFGLAQSRGTEIERTLTAVTEAGTLIGTISYMSPEQAQGIPVDIRSDLFSLGIVFFEALTGKLPFQRDTAIATLQAVAREPIPSLGSYGIEYAGVIDPVLRKLLAKSPKMRHANAAELQEELEKLAAGMSYAKPETQTQ